MERGLRAVADGIGDDTLAVEPIVAFGHLDDRALVEHARRRDAEAFTVLYRRHVDAIHPRRHARQLLLMTRCTDTA